MVKFEEDCNTVTLTVFKSSFLLYVTFDTMIGR